MKFLEKLLDEFKNLVYDFVIYIIPGFLGLLLVGLAIILIKEQAIDIKIFNEIINTNKILSKSNLDLIFYSSIIIYIYICGHIVSFYSKLLFKGLLYCGKSNKSHSCNRFVLCERKIGEKYNYLNEISTKLVNKFKVNIQLDVNNLDEKDINKLMNTYGSTNSRIEVHNNLIQKYIAKENMYRSFCLLSIMAMMDLVVYIIINRDWIFKFGVGGAELLKNISIILIIILCILGAFFEFFNEYIRHGYLRKKEIYIYLYNKFSNEEKAKNDKENKNDKKNMLEKLFKGKY